MMAGQAAAAQKKLSEVENEYADYKRRSEEKVAGLEATGKGLEEKLSKTKEELRDMGKAHHDATDALAQANALQVQRLPACSRRLLLTPPYANTPHIPTSPPLASSPPYP